MGRRPFKQLGGSLESWKRPSWGPERFSWIQSCAGKQLPPPRPGNVTSLARSPCRAPSGSGQLAADAPLIFLAAAASPAPGSAAPSPQPLSSRRWRRRSGERCKAEPGKWPPRARAHGGGTGARVLVVLNTLSGKGGLKLGQ